MSKRLVDIDEDRLLEIFSKAMEIAIVRYFTDVPYYSHDEKNDDEYLSMEEITKLLKASSYTIKKWVREGVLINRGKGRKYLFKRTDIKKSI